MIVSGACGSPLRLLRRKQLQNFREMIREVRVLWKEMLVSG